MAILGGSPLGIIGVESTPTRTGASTFPGAKNANFDVNKYNAGKSNGTNNRSIFYGLREFRPFPANSIEKTDAPENVKNYRISKMHSDSLYDTSILNILEKLSGTLAQLRSQDFAYLKDVGVYPNNRLMIARRFNGPVGNNLFQKGAGPLATMISWIPPGSENFFSLSFGEKWTEAESDFVEILNNLGDDFSKRLKANVFSGTGGLGGAAAAGFNAMPFPGITEQLQRSVLEKLGIYEDGSSQEDLPAGDPNLIKQAKRREVGGVTGFSTTFNINMTCEWEQKFLSGVDPTIVWLDIIFLVLRFGTSNSRFYGLGEQAAQKLTTYANNPTTLINDIISAIEAAINLVRETIEKAIQELADSLSTKPDEGNAAGSSGSSGSSGTSGETIDVSGIVQKIIDTMINAVVKLVRKYRVRIIGVINALSGQPSGPWHITIGNPMRPTFCSGDLIISSSGVKLEFGPTLAFNDLPSTIKATFQLENARTLGLDEIMGRFNTGYLRSVEYIPSAQEDALKLSQEARGVSWGSSGSSGSSGAVGTTQTDAGTRPSNNASSQNSTTPASPASNSYSNSQSGNSSDSKAVDNLYSDLNKGNPDINPGALT